MANNQYLSSADLDVNLQKNNIKSWLKNQSIFKDYNFDGSNMAVLIELLARNTYLNAYLLNMVGSESFLDSATLRESAVSKSKELNYIPRSRHSSIANVNITIIPANPSLSTITIPQYFYFSAINSNTSTLFSTNESIIVRNQSGSFTANNISIYEGRILTEYFVVGQNVNYVLSSANVDINSISVTVQNSSTDTTQTIFSFADTLYGLTDTSTIFFIQGYKDNYYELKFGNGVTGIELDVGNIIIVKYRETLGSDGDGFSNFRALTSFSDGSGNIYQNFSIITNQASIGGAERETIDSIKFNAPRHYATQNRAITPTDYEIMLRNEFPIIQAISVFGGESLAQKQYGRVIISTKPYGQTITPNAIKEQMKIFLQEKMGITVIPIFTDPTYFYVGLDCEVFYNKSVTNKTQSDIETIVRNTINLYANNSLNTFNSDFRLSRLSALIDNSDTSIVSNDSVVKMITKIYPNVGFAYSGLFNFGNKFISYPAKVVRNLLNPPIVYSDYFYYTHTDGSVYKVRLEDDYLGNLMVVTDSNDILVLNIGTVDYTNGIVAINNLIITSYFGQINIYADLLINDILITNDQILTINQSDINITITETTD